MTAGQSVVESERRPPETRLGVGDTTPSFVPTFVLALRRPGKEAVRPT